MPFFLGLSLAVTASREYFYPKFKRKQVAKPCKIFIWMDLFWLFLKEHCFVRRKQMQLCGYVVVYR